MNALSAANPLLDFSGLPRFADFRVEWIGPAVETLIAENRAAIAHVVAESAEPTWANFVQPLTDPSEKLERAWGQVSHLNAVVNSPELRTAYHAWLPKITAFYTELAQDVRLFDRYQKLSASPAYDALDATERRLVDHELRDFRLGGAELADDEKASFKAIAEELAELGSRYEDNVLDATNHFSLYIDDRRELAGIPDDVVAAAREAARDDGKPGFKLSLRMPCYLPVMQYAENRGLRETMYRAYATRASEYTQDGSKSEWDNSPLITRVLELRREAARLLGYKSYAELSLVPKMAKTPAEVLRFLDDLTRRAKPYAERDIAELGRFAADELSITELKSWDLPFASEKLRLARYAFSEQEVKQYFPEHRVLAGLFRVVETIYGVHIRESVVETWHESVRFFDITQRNGELIGQFYLDLYARPNKRGGAWMDDAINRRRRGTSVQHPVAYLTCNFLAPVNGEPALFTHDDVITLFHEFGHGLHLLLTEINIPGVSGIQGVEWDAVELPSQLMENFCWEWEVLKHMTAHVDTGEPLPRPLYDKMLAAKNFQSGMQTIRQLEFALFDMQVHGNFDPKKESPLALLETIRREVAVVQRPPYDRFVTHAFSHIFAGGYAAGYYSYKWAEVLSADAFSLFEQEGVLSPDVGALFRREILARGASRPALDSFVAFRGRPPQIDALLRHNGMSTS